MNNSLKQILLAPKKNVSVYNEYEHYKSQCIQHFGLETVLLYQNGSFYEIYSKQREYLIEYSRILCIAIASKNNYFMVGVPISAKNKYLTTLLNNNYTIVVIDQNDISEQKEQKITRSPVVVYSPGVGNTELDLHTQDSNTLLFIWFDKQGVGIVALDVQIGQIHCSFKQGNLDECLNFCYSFITRFQNIQEVSFYVSSQLENKKLNKQELCIEFDLIHVPVIHYNKHDTFTFEFTQNVFKQVYPQITSHNITQEYFHLDPLETHTLILMFLFINQRNPHYLKSLQEPIRVYDTQSLYLARNTSIQLGLFPNKLVDNTCKNGGNEYNSIYNLFQTFLHTSIGKRKFKSLLNAGFLNPKDITYRHTLTEYITQFDQKNILFIKKQLKQVYDIVKIYRRINLKVATVDELQRLNVSWNACQNLLDLLTDGPFPINEWNIQFKNDLDTINKKLDFDSESVFKKNVYPELDAIQLEIETSNNSWTSLVETYSSYIDSQRKDLLKIDFTESDGYYLSTTKLRGQVLETQKEKWQDHDSLVFSYKTKNNCRIQSQQIKHLSTQKRQLQEQFNTIYKKCILDFYNILLDLGKNWHSSLVHTIELLDLALCNSLISNKYLYSKPTIGQNKCSYINVKNLRHPLGERIIETQYIGSNVTLGQDQTGMLLYGINASGKSMLLKSIGIAIILAQSGMYVPCTSMDFYPYKTLISQVDLHDNFYKNSSSFMVEVSGIRNICKLANYNTLVLADELCKGTESTSGASLLGALICTLIEQNTSFLFTTHLHELSKVNCIVKQPKLRVCHLGVHYNSEKDTIIFDRHLKEGPCETLYGLKVAEYLHVDKVFMNIANSICQDIVTNKNNQGLILNPKKSKYNKHKKSITCEICNYKPHNKMDIPLDTHHINFQCTANEMNLIQVENTSQTFHKNSLFNLVTLCKSCHQKVHQEQIIIHKYENTLNNTQLCYSEHSLQ